MQNRADTAAIGGEDSNPTSARSPEQHIASAPEPQVASSAVTLPCAAAQGHLEKLPRVLLFGLPENARSELLRTLHGSGRADVLEFHPALVDSSKPHRLEDVDVAVIHAERLGPNLTVLLLHDPAFGLPELVFTVDSGCPAQRLALLSHGYRHVINDGCLASWLPQQLASLCTLARARRIVLAACPADTRAKHMTLGKPATGSMNLHKAETRFRETFLRALLTEHGSRRKAAEAAGVPYRSFCEMLRKLRVGAQ